MSKTQIVIVGGGFGGVYSALHLERLLRADEADIMLISRENYLLMTPLLFEASSGVLEARHAVNPIRPMLRRTRFIEAQVEQFDLDGRVLHARHAPSDTWIDVAYDHLVLALGGTTNLALIPGSERALTFKTLADAIYLRNHLIDVFERLAIESDPARRQSLLTVVVVGGGLVGVELMGELTEYTATLRRTYRLNVATPLRLMLLEASPLLLAEMDRDLADYAARVLEGRGVEIRLHQGVSAIDANGVRLADGTSIAADTVVLAAGVAPTPLQAGLPLRKDRKGRLLVQATLRSAERPEVWALGDCAAIPDPAGKPYPPLAQHALREARTLAENLVATLRGGELRAFVYQSKGTLASLDGFVGVGKVMGLKIRGFLAWWTWRTYYLSQTPRWDRKLRILLDWTIALFFKNDVVKLELFGEPHPGAPPSVEIAQKKGAHPRAPQ